MKIDVIKGNEKSVSCPEWAVRSAAWIPPEATVPPKPSRKFPKMELRCRIHRTIDRVSGNGMYAELGNGTPLLSLITGSGCMASAVVGCCLGAWNDAFEASVGGITAYNIAGETAAEKSGGPGTFRQLLFDAMYHQKSYDLEEREKVLEIRRI